MKAQSPDPWSVEKRSLDSTAEMIIAFVAHDSRRKDGLTPSDSGTMCSTETDISEADLQNMHCIKIPGRTSIKRGLCTVSFGGGEDLTLISLVCHHS